MTTLFQENKSASYDLHHCGICGRGKTNYPGKLSFMNDARGFYACHLCVNQGLLIKKRKMSKKEKKQMKKMRMEMSKMSAIPHITLDSSGKVVS